MDTKKEITINLLAEIFIIGHRFKLATEKSCHINRYNAILYFYNNSKGLSDTLNI